MSATCASAGAIRLAKSEARHLATQLLSLLFIGLMTAQFSGEFARRIFARSAFPALQLFRELLRKLRRLLVLATANRFGRRLQFIGERLTVANAHLLKIQLFQFVGRLFKIAFGQRFADFRRFVDFAERFAQRLKRALGPFDVVRIDRFL